MSDEIILTLIRADAERMLDELRRRHIYYGSEWRAIEDKVSALLKTALAAPADARANPGQDRQKSAQTGHNLLESDACNAPAEEPERAATGELEALIAECETRFLEWRLDGTWVEDGPGSAHWESAAAVRAHGWEDAPPDDADEDGWIGICDDRTDADLAGLLRSALRAAGEDGGA